MVKFRECVAPRCLTSEGSSGKMPCCIVCAKESSRYRCRLCRGAYCSSSCHKVHRDAEHPDHCTGMQKTSDGVELPFPQSIEGPTTVAALREGGENDAGAPSKRGGEGDANFIYGERDEDGVLVVLGEAHLAALAQDRNIRWKLRSEELQRLLRIIDSSRSRIDALDAAMANTREFKEFCDDVLRVVATSEQELKPRVL